MNRSLRVQAPPPQRVLAASMAGVNALKCPELLLRGVELQRRAALSRLEKKGKRFESPWNEYLVAIYAGVLFYYDDPHDLPRGIVPLAGGTVKAVDRIFKNSDHPNDPEPTVAEECGPCFKFTSSANRVLLFRCDSDRTRNKWIRDIQLCGAAGAPPTSLASTGSFLASSRSHASSEDAGSLEKSARSRSPSPSLSNRFSLDESHIRRQNRRTPLTTATTHSSTKGSTAASEVPAPDSEVSEMLREAMAMVNKQKIEILELRKALDEARSSLARTSSMVSRPSDAEDLHSAATTSDTIPEEETVSPKSEIPSPPPSITVEVSPTVVNSASVAAPLSVDTNTTDYLQKQAMELAEIARYLQLTFQNDVLSSVKQISSANSTAPTEMMDHVSTTSSNYSDHPSEVDEDESDADPSIGSEETDGSFVEPSAVLDSIQKVMRDFSSPSNAARTKSEQFIINDDIIAEIRQGVAADKKRDGFRLMDPHVLRSLRSQSACDESTDYKISLSPRSIARTQSAREFSIDDFDSPAPSSRHRKRLPKDLGLLILEDNMAVVSSILQTASREEKSSLLLPLVRVFNRHNRLSRLIQWAIESEVASVMNVATLFRSDDYASRLVSTYSKSVGSKFIKVILTDPIRDIYKLRLVDIDLTPKLVEEEDPDVVQQNAENLMNACQMVLDSILNNTASIPSSYFHICSHLNAKVINRFDGSMEGLAVEDPASLTRSVIGGFLFLRFVCPAITTPHLYELVDKEPPPETRKILVLVTKLLFKTATSVLFNEKEAHLKVLNPFIERNSPSIQQLFAELAVTPKESIDDSFASDSEALFADVSPDQAELDLAAIRTVASKNFNEIEKKLSVSGCSPATVENLRASLELVKGDEASMGSKGRSKKLNMKFLASFSKKVRKPSEV